MARYKAEHLKEMIREVVREEMREVVAQTIAEVLSERYLRKLAETAQPRGAGQIPVQGEDEIEEDAPEALSNDIFAPGQENPRFKKVPKDDGVRQFDEETTVGDLPSIFFEGTKSLTELERDAGMLLSEEDTSQEEPLREAHNMAERLVRPAPHLPPEDARDAPRAGRRPLTDVWKTLAGVDRPAQPAADPAAAAKFEEERLKRKREELDRKP